ncbi:MAG: hypothetical protein KAV42_05240 [Candidatus Krumholzibacteria bacterium]|nr:hypothetical protein [Candidatus Krumholzibacteria bacterium]
MKKCLLMTLALMLISTAAFAQAPPVGYIGLFVDTEHTSWCASGTPPYTFFIYIWCLPSENGQMCAEFAVDYSDDPGVIPTAPTPASYISVALGSLDGGMSVCFTECQTDWHYPFSQMLFINTPSKATVRIIEHPDIKPAPIYQFANCLEDFPMEPCKVFTNVYVNSVDGVDAECSTTAAEPFSWGAIKHLMTE